MDRLSWIVMGEMPAEERSLLDEWVATTYGENRRLRFWASPDTEPTWQTLLDAKADLVNTDDLAGLSSLIGGS